MILQKRKLANYFMHKYIYISFLMTNFHTTFFLEEKRNKGNAAMKQYLQVSVLLDKNLTQLKET